MGKFVKIIAAFVLMIFFVLQLWGLRGEYTRARLKILNSISVDALDGLVSIIEENHGVDPQRIDPYLKYVEAVLRLDNQRADAWGISGLCFALKGDYQRAIFAYIRASSIEPRSFGFYYNLAHIYFKTEQYDLAIAQIEKALVCDPRRSLEYILTPGNMYAIVLRARAIRGTSPEEQLKEGYQKAYQLLAASQYRQKMRMAFPGEEKLSLEMF
jgi:tetratricopeptide (TPR) repeat protein